MSDRVQPGVWINVSDLTKSQRRRFIYQVEDLYEAIAAENDEADEHDGTDSGSGWDVEVYREALSRLRGESRTVLATVIETARDQGGYITREKVYELAGYDPARSLRGFTRPVRRICTVLRSEGRLVEDAEDLLYADYDDAVSGYQRAGGFRVPDAVVDLDWEPDEPVGRIDHELCGHPMTKAARAKCRQERRRTA